MLLVSHFERQIIDKACAAKTRGDQGYQVTFAGVRIGALGPAVLEVGQRDQGPLDHRVIGVAVEAKRREA